MTNELTPMSKEVSLSKIQELVALEMNFSKNLTQGKATKITRGYVDTLNRSGYKVNANNRLITTFCKRTNYTKIQKILKYGSFNTTN